jgi:hypothetical protein
MSASRMVWPPEDEPSDDALLTEWERDFLASLDAQDYPQTAAQEDKARRDRAAARGTPRSVVAGAIMSGEPMMITGRTSRLAARLSSAPKASNAIAHGSNAITGATIISGRRSAARQRRSRGGPPGWLPIIVVRQVEPGARIRAACWVQGVH